MNFIRWVQTFLQTHLGCCSIGLISFCREHHLFRNQEELLFLPHTSQDYLVDLVDVASREVSFMSQLEVQLVMELLCLQRCMILHVPFFLLQTFYVSSLCNHSITDSFIPEPRNQYSRDLLFGCFP